MKHTKQKLGIFLLMVCLLVQLLPIATVLAASASASASPKTVAVGGTVTVKVTFKQSNIGAVSGTYSFDSNVLQFVSGSGAANGKIALVADASGSSSLSATLKFKAKKTGACTVSFKGDIIDFDTMNSVGSASASAKVTVTSGSGGGGATKKPSATPGTPTPTPTPFNPATDAIQVNVGGAKLYLLKDLTDIKLPEGYEAAKIKYQNQDVSAAKSGKTGLTMVYLTNEKGENGIFYIYDEASGAIMQYTSLSVGGEYVFLQSAKDAEIPEGYQETTLAIDKNTIPAYVLASGEEPDFYLVYVMNAEGTKGFYLYDSKEKTFQRFTNRVVTLEVEAPAKTPEPTAETADNNTKDNAQQVGFFEKMFQDPALMITVLILSMLSIILIIVVVVLLIKKNSQNTNKFINQSQDE